MTDAISRSMMVRLVEQSSKDAGLYYADAQKFLRWLRKAPALDVAPVVRCKDCRSSRKLSIKEMIIFEPCCLVCCYPHGAGVSYPEYDMTERIVAPNDYCSYGKRRTNGR